MSKLSVSSNTYESSDKLKGVILAGGKGIRLSPLTEITNKHLLPIGTEPMIWHAIKQLSNAGIQDIMVITSTEHMGDIVASLGSGDRFGCSLTYRVQTKALGIAHALQLCEGFIAGNKSIVLLADNIFEESLSKYINEFKNQANGARVLIKTVSDPCRYGVATVTDNIITHIEEKPLKPKSYYVVTGCYMYDKAVFEYINELTPSIRGEYEISDVNNIYIQKSKLCYDIINGEWIDAGTFQSLHAANKFMFEKYHQEAT